MADINIGAISEALNNKVDLPTATTPQDAVDFVVEKQDPTSANGYTWYRKYKSGWVEQGGNLPLGTGWMTLPVPMRDISVPMFKIVTNRSGTSYDCELYPTDVNTTQFYYYNVAPMGGGQGRMASSRICGITSNGVKRCITTNKS